MNKIKLKYILPSSAFTISSRIIRQYQQVDGPLKVGDLILGEVVKVGEHHSLENKEGRIHMISDGTRAIFVIGNRYAPDAFEGLVPNDHSNVLDLLARSGVVGKLTVKNALTKEPTKIKILGKVVNEDGTQINTLDYPKSLPKNPNGYKTKNRAKMILHVGSSMNSGKSTSAIACCWALSNMGYGVRASKITGTASLKDILHMQDAGAEHISDFTYMGYPSTYLLDEELLLNIFKNLDAKYANNRRKYWVVEFADGILQRETALLLKSELVRSRIHRLIFSANDALGAIGGVETLKKEYNLNPDAISGRCSSSPLMLRELQDRIDIPVYKSVNRDLKEISSILI